MNETIGRHVNLSATNDPESTWSNNHLCFLYLGPDLLAREIIKIIVATLGTHERDRGVRFTGQRGPAAMAHRVGQRPRSLCNHVRTMGSTQMIAGLGRHSPGRVGRDHLVTVGTPPPVHDTRDYASRSFSRS